MDTLKCLVNLLYVVYKQTHGTVMSREVHIPIQFSSNPRFARSVGVDGATFVQELDPPITVEHNAIAPEVYLDSASVPYTSPNVVSEGVTLTTFKPWAFKNPTIGTSQAVTESTYNVHAKYMALCYVKTFDDPTNAHIFFPVVVDPTALAGTVTPAQVIAEVNTLVNSQFHAHTSNAYASLQISLLNALTFTHAGVDVSTPSGVLTSAQIAAIVQTFSYTGTEELEFQHARIYDLSSTHHPPAGSTWDGYSPHTMERVIVNNAEYGGGGFTAGLYMNLKLLIHNGTQWYNFQNTETAEPNYKVGNYWSMSATTTNAFTGLYTLMPSTAADHGLSYNIVNSVNVAMLATGDFATHYIINHPATAPLGISPDFSVNRVVLTVSAGAVLTVTAGDLFATSLGFSAGDYIAGTHTATGVSTLSEGTRSFSVHMSIARGAIAPGGRASPCIGKFNNNSPIGGTATYKQSGVPFKSDCPIRGTIIREITWGVYGDDGRPLALGAEAWEGLAVLTYRLPEEAMHPRGEQTHLDASNGQKTRAR